MNTVDSCRDGTLFLNMASNDKYKNFTYQERIAEVARLYAENSRKNLSDVKWEADAGQRKKVTERRSETSSRPDDKYAKNDAAKAERDDRRAKQSR